MRLCDSNVVKKQSLQPACIPADHALMLPTTILRLPLPQLLQLIQMLEPCQNHLFTRLFDLAGQEDLVQNGVNFVEIEHEIELAHVPEELIEHLDEEVYGLEIGELVVGAVDADAKEEPGVSTIDYLCRALELDEVRLVFLIARCDQAMDLTLQFDLLFIVVWGIPFRQTGLPLAILDENKREHHRS